MGDAAPSAEPASQPLSGRRIAVFGSSTLSAESSGWEIAELLGRELARAGAQVLNGGYGGAMEAVSRGARSAGGRVLGVTLDGFRDRTPNTYLTDRHHAETLLGRLQVLFEADGFVALEGSVGTLTEFFLAWNQAFLERGGPRPLVCLGPSWRDFLDSLRRSGYVDDPQILGLVECCEEPTRAVAFLEQRLLPARSNRRVS